MLEDGEISKENYGKRNAVIINLAKQRMTQETIAAMLDIFQSTVSNVSMK